LPLRGGKLLRMLGSGFGRRSARAAFLDWLPSCF